MKNKNLFIIILLILIISCKNDKISQFKNYNPGKKYTKLNEEDSLTFFRISLCFSSNIGDFIKIKNKYIILNRLTRYMSTAGVIYEMNDKLELKELKRIPFGKGPGEGIALTDILILDKKYYIFDKSMHRFLIYDKDFNFIDTYNLNRPIPVSTFFKFNESLYAIEGKVEKMVFYKLTFDKKLKLKKEYEFDYEKARSNEKQLEHNRSYVKVFKDKNNYFITKTFNLICYFNKKDKIIKDRETYMGYSEGKRDSLTIPSIVFIKNKNIFFNVDKYKYYDYKKNKIVKIKLNCLPRTQIRFKNKIYNIVYKKGNTNIYLKIKK